MGLSVSRLLAGLFGKKEMRESQSDSTNYNLLMSRILQRYTHGMFPSNHWADAPLMIWWRRVKVGLDAAGKTTILYKLKLGEIVTTIPTIGLLLFKASRTHHIYILPQDLTWRLSSTRTFLSPYGTSEARTRFVLSGGTVRKNLAPPKILRVC
jgi:hypothetical protein